MRNLSLLKSVFLCLLFTSIFLVGCQKEQIQESEFQTETERKINTRSGQPDQPGDNLKVFRYEDEFVFELFDAESGLFAFVNADVIGFCNGDPNAIDILSFQDIVKVEDDDFPRVHRQIKGKNVHASVWDFIPDSCADVLSNDALFDGTGKFIYNDNDYFAFINDNPNKNAYGFNFTSKGTVISLHVVWDGDDFLSSKENIKIKVK